MDQSSIARWVSAGIIDTEQASQIRADLARHGPRRGSLVAEGLGYLGGVIVLVGLGFAVTLSWSGLSDQGRIGVAATIAGALLAAGIPVPVNRLAATGTRLRGVLWATATVAAAAALWLVGDRALHMQSSQVTVFWTSGAAFISTVLWALNRHVLQQLTTITFLALAAHWLTRTEADASFPNLAVWAVGVGWLVLALVGILPREGGPVLGALVATIGGLLLSGYDWGPLLALGTVVAVVVTAVALRELGLLSVGSVGTLITLPFAVDHYLPGGTRSTALALVAAGLALVAAGVWTARRRRAESPAPDPLDT